MLGLTLVRGNPGFAWFFSCLPNRRLKSWTMSIGSIVMFGRTLGVRRDLKRDNLAH